MPTPSALTLKKSERVLHIAFADGTAADLDFDWLRRASPAADGKAQAAVSGADIAALEPVGNYAVRPVFSDGYASGIYSWDFLYRAARQRRDE